MASMTNFMEEAILNHIFRGIPFTPPANYHVALFTAAPGEAGGGTEVSGGSYARVAIAPSTANFSDPSGLSETSNSNAIIFPAATADWGTIVAYALFDAASGGNMLFYKALLTPRSIVTGQTAQVAAGLLRYTAN